LFWAHYAEITKWKL